MRVVSRTRGSFRARAKREAPSLELVTSSLMIRFCHGLGDEGNRLASGPYGYSECGALRVSVDTRGEIVRRC